MAAKNLPSIRANTWENGPSNRLEEKPVPAFQPSAWDKLEGIKPPDVLRAFDGVSTLNPIAIKESYATKVNNLSSRLYPSMTVRDGYSYVGNTLIPAGTKPFGNMVYHVDSRQELHRITNTVWQKYNGTAGVWDTLKSDMPTPGNWKYDYVLFKGNYSTTNLITTCGNGLYRYDGTTVTKMTDVPNSGKPYLVEAHDNRLYAAGDQTVYFSALRKADDWTTVNEAGSLVLDNEPGGITGLVSGPSKLAVFKDTCMYELYGNGPSTYTLKPIAADIGCVDPRSIQTIDGVLYWVGLNGIYKYTGGSKPSKEFSLAVDSYVQQGYRFIRGPFPRASAVSWVKDGCYCVQLDLSTNPALSHDPIVLEYNPKFETWFVHRYPFSAETRGVMLSDSSENFAYFGAITNNFDVAYTIRLGRMYSTNNNADWEWVSKPYNYDSANGKKKLLKIWLVVDLEQGSTLNVSISPSVDGDDWTLLKSITAANKYVSYEIVVPVNWKPPQNFYRIKVHGAGYATIHEIARQERDFTIGVH